jgi:inositol phosphorylceramide mannosyltransferase catalytic subunit
MKIIAIPRIIHQTWKDERIPVSMQKLAASWKRSHPGWEYRLWTDKQNREFIRTHYPDFLDQYDSYPYHIQRVDAVRYYLLYTFGGLYVDLDFECFRSFERLLSEHECLFGLEPPEHCEIHNRDRIIGNALMATTPKHPFFRAIINDLSVFESTNPQLNTMILETTGPFMLSRVYDFNDHPGGVTLLPSQQLYPLSIFEAEQVVAGMMSETILEKLNGAYAAHYHMGTWWRS